MDEIQENTWVDSISLWAENVLIDGFTLNELYPDCVSEVQGSYRDSQSRVSLDVEAISIDLCVLSKPSVQVNDQLNVVSDPTVDD